MHGFGSNVFGQLNPWQEGPDQNYWNRPQQVPVPQQIASKNSKWKPRALNWSQSIFELEPENEADAGSRTGAEYLLFGLRPCSGHEEGGEDPDEDPIAGCFHLRLGEEGTIRSFLGADHCEAIVDAQGRARVATSLSWARIKRRDSARAGTPVEQMERSSASPRGSLFRKWKMAASDDLGKVMAVEEETEAVFFFPSIDAFVQDKGGKPYSFVETEEESTQAQTQDDTRRCIRQICAGASHFLILLDGSSSRQTSDHQLWGWGDDRFGQLQRTEPSRLKRSVDTDQKLILRPIRFFSQRSEGFPEALVQIAAGARHCAAVSESGAVYTWGANDQGQLGVPPASSASGVNLVELDDEGEESEAGVNMVSAGCGTRHTVLGAKDGSVWMTGADEETRPKSAEGDADGQELHMESSSDERHCSWSFRRQPAVGGSGPAHVISGPSHALISR
ncbi:hypothetical protein OC845_004695 [Tilletia horrida]|nr:hypothetical protein OC845_004695 [Tilletia horrida]